MTPFAPLKRLPRDNPNPTSPPFAGDSPRTMIFPINFGFLPAPPAPFLSGTNLSGRLQQQANRFKALPPTPTGGKTPLQLGALEGLNMDPKWLDATRRMAVKSQDWGFDLKADNPFHLLMALYNLRQDGLDIQHAYHLVSEIRGRVQEKIRLYESFNGRAPGNRIKLGYVYEVLEKDLGFQYQSTDNLMAGLGKGVLDCDTESFLVLAVAHEMGWPVHGVRAPAHFFVRWVGDDGEVFNMDLKGVSEEDADYLKSAEERGDPINKKTLEQGHYLKSLSLTDLASDYFAMHAFIEEQGGSDGLAREFCREALRLDPKNLWAWSVSGDLHHKSGELDLWFAKNNIKTHLDPGDWRSRLERGVHFMKRGQDLLGEKSLFEVLDFLHPTSLWEMQLWLWEESSGLLAKILVKCWERGAEAMEKGDWALAKQLLLDGLSKFEHLPQSEKDRLREDFLEAEVHWEFCLFKLGELPKERVGEVLEHWKTSNPDHPEFVLEWTKWKIETGELAAAETELEKILSRDSGNVEALVQFSDIQSARDDLIGATWTLEKALALDPDLSPAWERLGAIHLKQEEFISAQVALEKALEKSHDPRLRYYLAILHHKQGRPESALPLLQDYLLARPKDNAARMELAALLYDQDRYPEAKDQLQWILETEPTHARAQFFLGKCEFRLKNYSSANYHLDEALEQEPENPLIRSFLGWVALEEGRPEEAKETFEIVLMKNAFERGQAGLWDNRPNHEDFTALYGMGEYYLRKGKKKEARSYFNRAQAILPDSRFLKISVDKLKAAGA